MKSAETGRDRRGVPSRRGDALDCRQARVRTRNPRTRTRMSDRAARRRTSCAQKSALAHPQELGGLHVEADDARWRLSPEHPGEPERRPNPWKTSHRPGRSATGASNSNGATPCARSAPRGERFIVGVDTEWQNKAGFKDLDATLKGFTAGQTAESARGRGERWRRSRPEPGGGGRSRVAPTRRGDLETRRRGEEETSHSQFSSLRVSQSPSLPVFLAPWPTNPLFLLI